MVLLRSPLKPEQRWESCVEMDKGNVSDPPDRSCAHSGRTQRLRPETGSPLEQSKYVPSTSNDPSGAAPPIPLSVSPRVPPMVGQFPTELIEQIVDYVWDDPDELDFWWNYGEEYATLCSLSLTCRALRWRSQYNLLKEEAQYESTA